MPAGYLGTRDWGPGDVGAVCRARRIPDGSSRNGPVAVIRRGRQSYGPAGPRAAPRGLRRVTCPILRPGRISDLP